MESIVYSDTPLADYLEGSGEHDPTRDTHSPFIEPADPPQIFVPPTKASFRSRFSGKALKNLDAEKWGKRSPVKRVFSRITDTKLSKSENSQFLEQFRYIIVASQLLNEHMNVSHYDRKDDALGKHVDDTDNLFGDTGSITKRDLITGGGCAVMATLFASWLYRAAGGDVRSGRTYSIVVLIVVSIVVASVQVQRTWLRNLRMKAIRVASRFVETSQAFDFLAMDVVTIIQEVELVSRGYRLSTPLPPITRLERGNQTKRCSRMRRAVLSSLKLGIPSHIRAFSVLKNFIEEADMEKYNDIYEIRAEDMEELDNAGLEDDSIDLESLKSLKMLLHRLYTVRRIFLCSLLALDAKGTRKDFPKWRAAVEQLQSLGEMMAELSRELKRVMTEEEQFTVPPSPKSPVSPSSERVRTQLRKLNSLSQAVRGLQAKMHVLREDSDRSLEEDSVDFGEFSKELLAHFDSIGADIHALVDEWESSRAQLAASIEKKESRRSLSIGGSTLVGGDTPRTSIYDVNWAEDLKTPSPSTISEVGSYEPEKELFEAVSEPPVRVRSTLTREERIAKAREDRAKAAEEREKKEASGLLIRELKDVLDTRVPMPRRRVISGGNPKRFSL